VHFSRAMAVNSASAIVPYRYIAQSGPEAYCAAINRGSQACKLHG
jgi:hypothetical protein